MQNQDLVKNCDHGTLINARLLSPLDLEAPEYQQEMVISVGANFQSKKWKNDRMPIAKLIAILAKHPEGRRKDGPGFVLAEIIGDNRRKQAVAKCYGVGLDIDVGVPGAEIDELLKQFGHLAIRYTTFSHGKAISKLNRDKIVKWCDQQKIEFDGNAVLRFLREKTKWNEAILATAEYIGDEHEATGLMACISHAPMEKHRIVVLLADPFDPTKVANTHAQGIAMWADVCRALAKLLGDLPLDNAATDPSRLFYFPRHAKGQPHETTIVGGPLFDWRTLDLTVAGEAEGDEFDKALAAEIKQNEKASPKSKSKTDEGKKLGRWATKTARGFQIVDVIRDHADDRIRSHGSTKIDLECPFDEDHSNPGDPEDRGCFAVNGGDGLSPIFTIKCQHDSCQDKTAFDFLGKMIADGWFGEEVLHDDQYCPVVVEDDTSPATGTAVDAVLAQVAGLPKDPHPDDVRAVVESAAQLRSVVDISTVRTRLKKAGAMSATAFDQALKEAKRNLARLPDRAEHRVDADGLTIFEYVGDYDEPDVGKTLQGVMLALNEQDGERIPLLTYGVDGVTKMDRRAEDDAVVFARLSHDQFHAAANTRMALVRLDDNGNTGPRKHVPLSVSRTIYGNLHHHLPPTPEILRVPVYAANGELLRVDGWLEDHGVWMEKAGLVVEDVLTAPTTDDVEDALALLKGDLLADFPLLDFDSAGVERREPSEANCLSMLITPFMRRMIPGVTPIFWVSKPKPGTGGTLLGGVPYWLLEGSAPVPMAYSPGNDEENQKNLVAAIAESRSVLFYDDCPSFTSRVVTQGSTSRTISGRILGRNETIQRANNFLWIGSGNNTYFGQDMARRIVPIRLNITELSPTKRNFRHADLEAWITDNRGKLVHAILILIQNWIARGRPEFADRTKRSFEGWCRTVGGVLQAAGVEGFLDTRDLPQADPNHAADNAFVGAWWRAFGQQPQEPRKLADWAITLALDVVEGRTEADQRRRLLARLRGFVDQTFAVGKDTVRVLHMQDGDTIAFLLKTIEAPE